MAVSLDHLRGLATDRLAGVEPGQGLDALTIALVDLGVKAAVTALDEAEIEEATAAARSAGASTAQLEETVALVSGLGVHSLMVAAPLIWRSARAPGAADPEPLDPTRQALRDSKVGNDPFWRSFERDVPGFLDALIRLAPETFRAFFEYCAVPWRSGTVPALTKELTSMACDATPAHRFLPGFRLHLGNAIKLGAGSRAVTQALDLAAACGRRADDSAPNQLPR